MTKALSGAASVGAERAVQGVEPSGRRARALFWAASLGQTCDTHISALITHQSG